MGAPVGAWKGNIKKGRKLEEKGAFRIKRGPQKRGVPLGESQRRLASSYYKLEL